MNGFYFCLNGFGFLSSSFEFFGFNFTFSICEASETGDSFNRSRDDSRELFLLTNETTRVLISQHKRWPAFHRRHFQETIKVGDLLDALNVQCEPPYNRESCNLSEKK